MRSDEGLASRRSRVRDFHPGGWASSSVDFVHLAKLLFTSSAQHSREFDGNVSPYTLAGLPMLFSSLRCLLIELNSGPMWGGSGEPRQAVLADLAVSFNDIAVVRRHYALPAGLSEQLELLLQVRHEILHPAHRPGGEADNTPAYLRPLRELGLLQSTGDDDADYPWISQLRSHRLFKWAFETFRSTVHLLLHEHRVEPSKAQLLMASYSPEATEGG